jgi:hypothetical protein
MGKPTHHGGDMIYDEDSESWVCKKTGCEHEIDKDDWDDYDYPTDEDDYGPSKDHQLDDYKDDFFS